MKKVFNYFALLFVTLLATSCLYGVGTDEGTDIENTSGFKVEVSANVISANGEDAAVFKVYYNGEDVTSESTVYDATTNQVVDNTFTTYTLGVYSFYVTYGEYRSENIEIQAVLDIDLSDKDQAGLSFNISTNLVQVGKGYVAFVVRYNGKVLSVEEVKKISIYDLETNEKLTVAETDTVGSLFSYAAFTDENGKEFLLPIYSPNEAGTKSFWVGYKTSNTRDAALSITAVESNIPSRPVDPKSENINFVRRVLLTQFTGTWCGNCPYMIEAFHKLMEDSEYNKSFVHTAVHNGDEFALELTLPDGKTKDLSNILNATGNYPYVLANLSTPIANSYADQNLVNLKSVISSTLKTKAKAGVAARTELKDNMLLVRASVKAAESGEYFVGAWLVESNLYAKQSNYTQNKEDYIDIHENVVRIADSYYGVDKMIGHSLGIVLKGSRADHLFIMELNPEWKQENCHLVLFVSTADGKVTNVVATESLTSGVGFQYAE